jgi:hypothetical protein
MEKRFVIAIWWWNCYFFPIVLFVIVIFIWQQYDGDKIFYLCYATRRFFPFSSSLIEWKSNKILIQFSFIGVNFFFQWNSISYLCEHLCHSRHQLAIKMKGNWEMKFNVLRQLETFLIYAAKIICSVNNCELNCELRNS